MRTRSPLDYDVSAAADKRRRQRPPRMTGAVATGERTCEWEGCAAAAHYRAPRSPRRLNEFRWFCLDHVRQYNSEWNFFADWTEEEFEAMLEAARVWERPTFSIGGVPRWALGLHPHSEGKAWARWGFSDPFEVLGSAATLNPGPNGGNGAEPLTRRRLPRAEREAMHVLGLAPSVESRGEVRARYRELILMLHPDMNGGRNPEPERLARVLKAWQVLRVSPHLKG
jgi:hypothetical protein